MIKRPKTIICYICGREYGTRSLEIHIKSCEKKWEIEQQNLPKKQRRPCPQAPAGFENVIRVAQGKKPIISATDQQPSSQEFDIPIKPGMSQEAVMAQYNDAAFKNWDQNVLEPCPNCNRTFLPRSL